MLKAPTNYSQRLVTKQNPKNIWYRTNCCNKSSSVFHAWAVSIPLW